MALDFSKAGYIYILTNESLGNLVKIGYTKNPPEERAKELFTTGVPTPYRVWSFDFVEDAEAVEEAVHVALYQNRSNRDREFFNISPDEAKKTVDRTILEKREEFLKHGQKRKNEQYSNPKFVEAIKFLKENQGKLFSDKDLAQQLKISEKGVGQIIYMLESQETPVLYTNPDPKQDKKYGIYVKFGKEQLGVLENKYPNLDFSEVRNLFERNDNKQQHKKSYTNNQTPEKKQQGQAPQKSQRKFDPLEYENPKFIELIKVLKENQGNSLLTADELAEKVNNNVNVEDKKQSKISGKGVRQIIGILEQHQFDIVFVVPQTEKKNERFGIDFNFDKQRLKELDEAYPKMNLAQLEPLFEQKEKRAQERRKDIDQELKTDSLEQQVQKIQESGQQPKQPKDKKQPDTDSKPANNEAKPEKEQTPKQDSTQSPDKKEQPSEEKPADKGQKIKRTNVPAPNGGRKFYF